MIRFIARVAAVVSLLPALALAVLAAWLLHPVSPREIHTFDDTPVIRFAAFGDQGTGNFRQWQIASALDTVADSQPLDFVMLLGDNFYRYGVDDVDDWQWRYKFENLYAFDSLAAVPFYAVAGNHDYYGNVQAEIDYGNRSLGSGRWRMPASDYVVTAGRDHLLRLVVIDTSSPRDLAATAARLAELLAEGVSTWTVVATHTPVRSGRNFYDPRPVRDALLPVLVAGRVDLYLSGHDHNLQVIEVPGEPLYAVVGAGGKYGQPVTDGFEPGLTYFGASLGFAKVEAGRDRLTLAIVNEHAETLFETHRERAAVTTETGTPRSQ